MSAGLLRDRRIARRVKISDSMPRRACVCTSRRADPAARDAPRAARYPRPTAGAARIADGCVPRPGSRLRLRTMRDARRIACAAPSEHDAVTFRVVRSSSRVSALRRAAIVAHGHRSHPHGSGLQARDVLRSSWQGMTLVIAGFRLGWRGLRVARVMSGLYSACRRPPRLASVALGVNRGGGCGLLRAGASRDKRRPREAPVRRQSRSGV